MHSNKRRRDDTTILVANSIFRDRFRGPFIGIIINFRRHATIQDT